MTKNQNGNGSIKSAEFRGMMLERTEIILKDIESLRETVTDHTKTIEQLKIKASLWGFLAGSIPSLVTALILLFR
ncbi:MAG: hypothetical protein JW984_15305 [Deltaproteobacteria bacterium]|uniref:Uncharacterized protein n=1 Tax=Candidatus Zymogenus saltonus TaxID=2844893 RepID=A0A9D8PR98_9DELT|nr:hypothetical protein [Candidatus Zymogenus saltonus]